MKFKLKLQDILIGVTLFIIGVFIVLLSCVSTSIYSIHELWIEGFAAILGTILTAIATFVLLRGQTRSQLDKDRNSAVFKECLNTYQGFLNSFCEILEDRKITSNEVIKLQFQLSYIAMHLPSEDARIINNKVQEILELFIKQKNDDNNDNDTKHNNTISGNTEELQHKLYEIVRCFHNKLYEQNKDDFDLRRLNMSVKSLTETLERAVAQNFNIESLSSGHVESWESALNNFIAQGWNITKRLPYEFTIKKDDIEIMSWVTGGRYTIGIHCDKISTYRKIRDIYGGRYTTYCWWDTLKDDNAIADKPFEEKLMTYKPLLNEFVGKIVTLVKSTSDE